MRPPGSSLRLSGGDVMLGDLWLKPHQLDALVAHHTAALAGEPTAKAHHAAWLHDLDRVLTERTHYRRAAGPGVPSPLRGGERGRGCRADVSG
jgi:hypothetical protein